MDLLDRMLTVDEAERIDVAGIRQHPWFRRRMRPLLEEAIQKMEAEQAKNEVEVSMDEMSAFCLICVDIEALLGAMKPYYNIYYLRQCTSMYFNEALPGTAVWTLSLLMNC